MRRKLPKRPALRRKATVKPSQTPAESRIEPKPDSSERACSTLQHQKKLQIIHYLGVLESPQLQPAVRSLLSRHVVKLVKSL